MHLSLAREGDRRSGGGSLPSIEELWKELVMMDIKILDYAEKKGVKFYKNNRIRYVWSNYQRK